MGSERAVHTMVFVAFSIMENWTVLEGEVTALGKGSAAFLGLLVRKAETVPGYPALLYDRIGKELHIFLTSGLPNGLRVGDRVRLQARSAGSDRVVARPEELVVVKR